MTDAVREKLCEYWPQAEELFMDCNVRVKLKKGLFSEVEGRPEDVLHTQKKLHQLLNIGKPAQHAIPQTESVNSSCPVEGDVKMDSEPMDTTESADVGGDLSRVKHGQGKGKGRHRGTGVVNRTPGASAPTAELFADHVDIEGHIWRYITYKNQGIINDFAEKFSGSLRQKVFYNGEGKRQSRLEFSSPSQDKVHEALEELGRIYRALLEGDGIVDVTIELDENDAKMCEEMMSIRDVMVLPGCFHHIIGPKAEVEQAGHI